MELLQCNAWTVPSSQFRRNWPIFGLFLWYIYAISNDKHSNIHVGDRSHARYKKERCFRFGCSDRSNLVVLVSSNSGNTCFFWAGTQENKMH